MAQSDNLRFFGIMTLIFAGCLIAVWVIWPVFFGLFLIPFGIFAAIICVGVTALMVSSKKNKSSSVYRKK